MATFIAEGFSNYSSDLTTACPGQYANDQTTVTVPIPGPGSYTVPLIGINECIREVILIGRRVSKSIAVLEDGLRDVGRAFEKAMISRSEIAHRRRPKTTHPYSPAPEIALTALPLPAPLTFRRRVRRESHNRGLLLNFCKLRPA